LQIDELKRQLAQLDALIADGVLTGDAARNRRDELEARIVDAVLAGDPAPAAAAAPASTTAAAAARPSRSLVASLVVFVLLFGVAGYAWRGNFDGLRVGPGEAVEGGAAEVAQNPKNQAEVDQQIEAMVSRLAERLKTQPDDVEGLAMLARSYTALRRFNDALPLYKRVLELQPRNAQAMVDYADALAVVNKRSLDGQPEALVMQAVKLDPANLKALSLAGTVAFNHADYTNAVLYWQKAIDISQPDGELARQLQGAVAEARQRGHLPAPAQLASGPRAGAAAGRISGRVSLAPALKAKVAPGDTLFIFARPASGARMPLAVLKKRVTDLPLDFTLDDSLAMSPAARLSSATQVIVEARISKSGNAMPQPGDLEAKSAVVPVGTAALQLQIADTVH